MLLKIKSRLAIQGEKLNWPKKLDFDVNTKETIQMISVSQ